MRRLSEETQFLTRDKCPACRGHGVVMDIHPDEAIIACPLDHCQKVWTKRQVNERGHKGMRMTQLPCTHTIENRKIEWRRPRCSMCIDYEWLVGRGYLPRFVSWYEFMETLYPEDDEQTTAALRVLSQASQSHHRDAFARSGEPTVTAPPQSPLYQQGYQAGGSITPNLGTNILEFENRAVSPHLPPVSPYNANEDMDHRSF